MRISLFTLAFVSVLTLGLPAHAEHFLWQDPKTGATLTFPDTWAQVSTRAPDEVIRIAGPAAEGAPICRLRVRADNRYTVYPVEKSSAVQLYAYSRPFWNDYLGEFDQVQIHSVEDGRGLGKAFASLAFASYTPTSPDPFVQQTALMLAGVYFDTAYVFDCAAEVKAFKRWQPVFFSIAKSVDLKKTHHELLTGDYRDFITNQPVRLPNPDGITSTVY